LEAATPGQPAAFGYHGWLRRLTPGGLVRFIKAAVERRYGFDSPETGRGAKFSLSVRHTARILAQQSSHKGRTLLTGGTQWLWIRSTLRHPRLTICPATSSPRQPPRRSVSW